MKVLLENVRKETLVQIRDLLAELPLALLQLDDADTPPPSKRQRVVYDELDDDCAESALNTDEVATYQSMVTGSKTQG